MHPLDELVQKVIAILTPDAEPSFTDAVAAATTAVLTSTSQARRLLAALTDDPSMPIRGDVRMPRALHRIVWEADPSQQHFRLPACERCSATPKRSLVSVASARMCPSCAQTLTRTTLDCAECGNSVRNARRSGELAYCRPCWRSLCDRRTRIAVTATETAGLTVTASEVERALEAASPNVAKQLQVALELASDPIALLSNPASGTPALGRLYLELREHSPDLPPVLCAVCRTEKPLPNRTSQGRTCTPCATKARAQSCSKCKKIAPVSSRLPDGSPLCQTCARTLPDRLRTCSSCHKLRPVASWRDKEPLCSSCRLAAAVDTCTRCGLIGECRFAGTSRAVCEKCRRKVVRCFSCGAMRRVHARDDLGNPLCATCRRKPGHQCAGCGNIRPVIARVDGAPYCDHCWRHHPASFNDCAVCGERGRVRRSGLCDRCTIRNIIASLFSSQALSLHPEMTAVRDGLLAHSAGKDLHVFLSTKSFRILETLLSADTPITHEALDDIGVDQTTRHVRSLLVEYGVLEPVDFHLRRFELWIPDIAENIAGATERTAFIQYARWKHVRELQALPAPIMGSRTTSRRRELYIVIDLLSWFDQRRISLRDITQSQLDEWALTGTERHRVTGFLRWARRNGLARELTVFRRKPPGPTPGGPADEERKSLLHQILHDASLAPGTKLAGALLLLYGVDPYRLVRITLDQIDTSDGLARIDLGPETLYLPEELGLVALATQEAREAQRLQHTVEDTFWLFPGTRSGYHLANTTLTSRLHRAGLSVANTRRGARTSLAGQLHPTILAALTGIHIRTAVKWYEALAVSRSTYVAALLEDGRLSPTT